MTHLTLSVLGALQVTLDGEPVKAFRPAKTRALLVYLALETNRFHTRRFVCVGAPSSFTPEVTC